jgi:hypothetical protein
MFEYRKFTTLEKGHGFWVLIFTRQYSDNSHKQMSCKWIFNIKDNVNGSMAKHKAHLVAKG